MDEIIIPPDKFLLVSIFGSSVEDFVETARLLLPFADGFELNFSCSHCAKAGLAIGQDLELVDAITRAVVSLGKPVIAKVSPVMDFSLFVPVAVKAGISGFTAINTLGPETYEVDGQPVLSNKVGSISGRAVFGLGLNCVSRIRALTNLPIIGGGGIATADDVRAYKRKGADFFGIGTALARMSTSLMETDYFPTLLQDMEEGTNKASVFVKDPVEMEYGLYRVAENRKLAEDLFLLRFSEDIACGPGQFVFVWIPGKGERPFSVLANQPLSLLVRKRGCCTEALAEMNAGDSLYIRGPHGKSPDVSGKILLVGGGTGIAALPLFAERYGYQTVAVLGAEDGDHLFAEPFNKSCQCFLFTNNGSRGEKGFVTKRLGEIIHQVKPRFILNCGPEPMVREAIRIEKDYLAPDKILSSLEFRTECGEGFCGKCASKTGYRHCVDGTFMTPGQLGIF